MEETSGGGIHCLAGLAGLPWLAGLAGLAGLAWLAWLVWLAQFTYANHKEKSNSSLKLAILRGVFEGQVHLHL